MSKFGLVKYSNSCIESNGKWPTEVAVGYSLKKIKFLAKIKNGEDHKAVLTETGYSVYGSGGKFAYASKFLYQGESILLGRKGTIDKPLYVNEKFWTVDTMFYSIPKPAVNAKFLYYASTTIPFEFYSTSTTIPSMTQFDLNNHKLAWPDAYEEQTLIVDFLDTKTSQIDEVIALKQKQIDLLKERKQIIIQQAVTRGLNPDVLRKNSGFEWLGEIPEHWGVESFKNVLVERNEKNYPIKSRERLSLSIDKGITLYSEKTTNLDRFKDDFSQYKLSYEGDLVFNSMNMIVGAVGVSEYFGCVSPVYYTYYSRLGNSKVTKFYEHFFKSKTVQSQLYRLGKGIMAIDRGEGKFNTVRLKVSREDLRSMKVPFPKISEIIEIVDFIDLVNVKTNELIELHNQQIKNLKEYKTTLINSAVTGKIKVTEQA